MLDFALLDLLTAFGTEMNGLRTDLQCLPMDAPLSKTPAWAQHWKVRLVPGLLPLEGELTGRIFYNVGLVVCFISIYEYKSRRFLLRIGAPWGAALLASDEQNEAKPVRRRTRRG